MVIWALPKMSKLGGSSCCQTLGGSIIIGASSLAGIVESPLPKVLSQYHLSMMHSVCTGCLGYLHKAGFILYFPKHYINLERAFWKVTGVEP